MTYDEAAEKDLITRDGLKEMARGFQISRILLSAIELGLFTALGEKSATSDEVAHILGTRQRSTDRLMNALCVLRLLKKQGSRFSNTPAALRFLVKSSPEYLAGLMHMVNMWDPWGSLTQSVKNGTRVLTENTDKRGKDWLTAFIAAMHELAVLHAPQVVALLDLSNVSRLLDVGGGSGAYAVSFVQARQGLQATVFDLPGTVLLTKRYIKQAGLLDKITIVSGDYNVDELGGGYDLVFLSAVVHSNSFEQNAGLIKKCARALNTGGQIVVQDFIMDEDRTSPAYGAFFALNMLVATEGGDTYTEEEARSWLREAGLSDIRRKNTDFGTVLIMGRK